MTACGRLASSTFTLPTGCRWVAPASAASDPSAHPRAGAPPHRGALRPRAPQAGRQTPARRLGRPRVPAASTPVAAPLTDFGSIFSTPWQKITSATDAVAQSHQTLAHKIESDVERPLRDFVASNREVQTMGNISGNLAAIAKDIDLAQKKTAKLRDKGAKAKASAVADAAQEIEKAELLWDSQAPYVFEQLQAIDEIRLNQLRDLLTQLQTHEVDQVERSRITAEETLNVVLNVETADEIQTWALRMRSGDVPPPSRKLSSTSTPSRTLAPPPIQTTPGAADDNRSQKSGSGKVSLPLVERVADYVQSKRSTAPIL